MAAQMPAKTPARKKLTRQDLREAAEKYKNWGKSGPDAWHQPALALDHHPDHGHDHG